MFGPCSRAEDQCILIRNNLKPRTMSTIAAYIIGFNSEIWMQKNDAPRKMGKEGGVGGEGGGQKEKMESSNHWRLSTPTGGGLSYRIRNLVKL